ncbi:hypothetical protein BDV97DRAFT_355995 [Delphinella strobiligena]|nr:hypothetical protein BDV97DRAFT_355995 [Delphinella strobiligena]
MMSTFVGFLCDGICILLRYLEGVLWFLCWAHEYVCIGNWIYGLLGLDHGIFMVIEMCTVFELESFL